MADTKKTRTASGKTDPSDAKPLDESPTTDDAGTEETVEAVEAEAADAVDDATESAKPDATSEADAEAIADAEVIEEIAATGATAEEEALSVDGAPEIEDPEDEAPQVEPAEDGSDPAQETAAVTEEEAADDRLDPEAPSEEDVADLQTLDGATPEEVADASVEPERLSFEPEHVEQSGPVPPIGKETVVVEKRGGVMAGFLGGAIATLGLAFAAPFVIPANMMPDFGTSALKVELASLRDNVGVLEGELGAVNGNVETLQAGLSEAAKGADLEAVRTETGSALATVQEALSALQTETSDLDETRSSLQALRDSAAAMTSRIDELEKRPIAEATDPASIAAVEAYGREVAKMREDVAAMLSRSEEMVAQAAAAAEDAVKIATNQSQEAIAAARAEAAAAAAAAASEAAAAAERAARAERAQAMVDIQAALETGDAFPGALAKLDGIEVPPALADVAADGVATLAEVQEAFAPAARAALAASREVAGQESVQGRLTTFLKAQSGFRSLAPREGDDPDAVLSRAQAAAVEARLTDAIAEISALPDVGQQEMAEWVAMATKRVEAAAAADELAANLATN